jgi:hypothetical protein
MLICEICGHVEPDLYSAPKFICIGCLHAFRDETMAISCLDTLPAPYEPTRNGDTYYYDPLMLQPLITGGIKWAIS